MHTMDWTDPESGKDWHVHHNGDYSGDVVISFPLKTPINPDTYEREHEDVVVPFDLLQELVGQYIAGRFIDKLEDAGGMGTIDWILNP